ncbi:FBP C-terminal treble-clef zinc-finger [Nocardioides scoriae]|uniref:FBP C-terminal treble-clef zinc-finger n=1 Tax=Nocardioides scoriae TaxID=642780 RepID=A0A1H1P8H3_9ACTN|nr:FBP domain-containing protein [Nocardioides scoriae]SDS07497.1 FBP C-terminal treble-clef zinc-finger [Nocardioides scoriae]
MTPLTEREIRSSFANCSKGEATRAQLPDLDETPWADLDFLGWPDPSGSQRAYLVLERDGRPLGLQLRQSSGAGAARSSLCQVCITSHSGPGVALAVARKTGAAGRKGDSTGLWMCRDLRCSLYVRGTRVSGAASLRETLPVGAAVERLRRNLDQFVDRVLAG